MVLYCLLVLLDVHTLLKKMFFCQQTLLQLIIFYDMSTVCFDILIEKGITVFVQLYNMEKIFSFFFEKKNSHEFSSLQSPCSKQGAVKYINSVCVQFVYCICTLAIIPSQTPALLIAPQTLPAQKYSVVKFLFSKRKSLYFSKRHSL